MTLNTKNLPKNNSNFVEQPIIDPDVYPSYLVQLIDLGLQPQKPYKGVEKPPVNKVMFTYELSECFMLDENGDELEDKPRWISETLPIYPIEVDNAKSTKRYEVFDPDHIFGGDFSKTIGVAVNVTVVNNKQGDKIYTNVGDVAGISEKKAAKMPPLKNPVRVFDLEVPDIEVFYGFPNWIQELIKGNLNFKGSVLEKAIEANPKKQDDKADDKKKASGKGSKPVQGDSSNDAESQEDDDSNPY